MFRQNADADLPGRDANGEGEDDRSLIAIGHQNPIAQPATACQIELRLTHICKSTMCFVTILLSTGSPLHSAYSMNWSARTWIVSGIVNPIAFAVLRLRTKSNFAACSTGRSAGFAPLKSGPRSMLRADT